MGKHKISKFNILALTLLVLALGPFLGFSALAQMGESRVRAVPAKKITQADREAAAERFKAAKADGCTDPGAGCAVAVQGGTPDYFGVANWANSPILTKFMDKLPGLGPAGANLLGQYIPVAKPDIVTYPGSDYYEISVVEYNEKMHTQLPATRLRGYVQTNLGTNTAVCGAAGQPACTSGGTTLWRPTRCITWDPSSSAQKDRPVRIKFTNDLPTGAAGKLFLPGGQDHHGRWPSFLQVPAASRATSRRFARAPPAPPGESRRR